MYKHARKVMRRIGAALVLALASVQAQAIPLSALLDGGSIEIGDKLFDNFVLLGDPVDPELSAPINLAGIEVTGIGDGTAGNEFGLNFAFDEPWSIGSDAEDEFDFMDLFFGYTATALNPGNAIVGVTLAADAVAEGVDAFATVVKGVFDLQQQDLLGSPLEVFSDTLLGESLSTAAGFAAQASVLVTDNIALFFDASQGASAAAITGFQQRFVQAPVDMPVPATLALALLGLAGLVVSRRRA